MSLVFAHKSSRTAPDRALEWSRASFLSVLFHVVLLLHLALILMPSNQDNRLSDPVLNSELLPEDVQEDLPAEIQLSEIPEAPIPDIQNESPAAVANLEAAELLDVAPITGLEGLGSSGSPGADEAIGEGGNPLLQGGGIDGGNGTGGEEGWKGMLNRLRRNGLDIVIVFDSTGSMGGEIQQVKKQMRRIGASLLELVPTTRISLCTYRDRGDAYLVQGLSLTSDLQKIDEFLDPIQANGGGDAPEAVDQGLRWAMENNRFRPRARKVILVFGDAPPHKERFGDCVLTAAKFRRQRRGIVSTVTCRNRMHIPEFQQIARAGGGEAFLTSDERQIMKQLLVLVFGSKYQDDVLKAFGFGGHQNNP